MGRDDDPRCVLDEPVRHAARRHACCCSKRGRWRCGDPGSPPAKYLVCCALAGSDRGEVPAAAEVTWLERLEATVRRARRRPLVAANLGIDERQGDQYGWALDYETADARASGGAGGVWLGLLGGAGVRAVRGLRGRSGCGQHRGGLGRVVRLAGQVVFWQSIANSTNPVEFEAYLAQFPNGVFRALAEARLASLRCHRARASGPRTWPDGRGPRGCAPRSGRARPRRTARRAWS